ncbi:hypothetical protein L798_10035 [Zootermopsis nevadensis]|uniref:Uncharacterized protein n=1 Tax=Zootermopsis nevadensis TaxID=136037 RepID=A0A067R0G8_ZOONE|nr:hypothetical protein L798_10035 [Zootermopsis nevadensis]
MRNVVAPPCGRDVPDIRKLPPSLFPSTWYLAKLLHIMFPLQITVYRRQHPMVRKLSMLLNSSFSKMHSVSSLHSIKIEVLFSHSFNNVSDTSVTLEPFVVSHWYLDMFTSWNYNS